MSPFHSRRHIRTHSASRKDLQTLLVRLLRSSGMSLSYSLSRSKE